MTRHRVLTTLLAATAFAGATAPAAFAAPPRESTPRPRVAGPRHEVKATLLTAGRRGVGTVAPVSLV